ncbi:MAG: hypothetical protein VX320_03745, partial [Candidatus Thermoplasmatota archaeon]|nr:hypothetical protein [Candidatus Thermoplasmatota archaeon]
MSAERLSRAIPLSMVLLMVFSTTLIHLNPATEFDFELDAEVKFTDLNQNTTLNVYSENGSSPSLKAEVPIDHTVESIGLSISPDVIAYNDAFSWSSFSDWTAAGASLDQVEVNKSTGLEMLPRIWNWDFESGSFSSDWTLTSSNGNTWNIQTGTVLQGSRTPKAGTVSHNQESAMHLDVSSLPSATGTFRYRVSSESNYDYLLFCKDNTGCSRFSGYTNRWSGNLGTSTQSFSISASTQTLTWKYIKDGSVNTYSDTAWVDDITIAPSGGSGGDTANWTSAKFGPEITGTHGSDSARYGITSIDATIPTGSNLRASIIDGNTGTAIPGYEDLDPHWFDLGQIDSELHPSLRLKLFFDASAGGASPIVHKIHMNHRYGTSFSSSPLDAGWSLSGMAWNNGQISGSSGTSATSPIFTSHRPISQMRFTSVSSGSFNLEASLDGDSWQNVNSNGISTFADFGSTLQFRVTCTNSCSVTDLTMELIGGHLPTHPRFDIGLDGWNEWEVIHPHVSEWGWQNRLSNGQLSADLNWVAPGLRQVGIMLPKDGIESFSVYLSPFTTMESVDVAIRIGNVEIGSKNIVFSKDSASFELTASEVQTLNSELSNTSTYWGVGEDVKFALAMLEIEGTSGSLRVGGLSAISRPTVDLSFEVNSAFVMSMNQALGDAPIQSQKRLVSLPIFSSTIGAYTAAITELVTAQSVVLDAASLSNFSHLNAVTPSWQWMELDLNYSLTAGTSADFLSLVVETDSNRAFYEFPVDGSGYSMTRLDGTSSPLQFTDSTGGAIFKTSTSTLEVSIPIQTAASLDDSSNFKLSASLYMESGPPSLPFIQMAGQSSAGVENDIQLIDWQVINELGYEIPDSMSYLRSSSPISVEVDLGFEGLMAFPTKNPRSGDVRVHLMENG